MVVIQNTAVIDGGTVYGMKDPPPFIFDGVVRRQHNQPDTGPVGDSAIEFMGKMLNEYHFIPRLYVPRVVQVG